MPLSISDLNVINFLVSEAFKMRRKDFRDIDNPKHVLLQCWAG